MEKRGTILFQILGRTILLLLPMVPMAAAEGGFPVRQEGHNRYRLSAPLFPAAPEAPFEQSSRRIIRFYPPVSTESYPYLQFRLAKTGSGTVSVLLDRRRVVLSLPEIPQGGSLYLELPRDSYLQGVELADGQAPAGEMFRPVPVLPSEGILRISWDEPDVLEYSPPPGVGEGHSFYSLTVRNQEIIRIEGVEARPLLLKPFREPQKLTLYPEESSSPVWKISPLNGIAFLRMDRFPLPPFPAPLPAELQGILHRPRESWRHGDFELYSWTRFPEILIWDCGDYEIQNRFFRRLAYFVEKKGFRGTLMTNRELEGRHGWNAHDYRPEDLADFYNLARQQDFPLYDEERIMLTILLRRGILREEPEGELIPGEGAVLSISRESPAFLRERFLIHEAAHGLYFISGEFRQFVRGVWEGLREEDRAMWRFFMGWYGYDPLDEDLMINEFQAYLLQQSSDRAPEYFDIRMGNLISSYPEQRSLLERGTGRNSGSFRQWSEEIRLWIEEKWGLLPGDFFPLYKELP